MNNKILLNSNIDLRNSAAIAFEYNFPYDDAYNGIGIFFITNTFTDVLSNYGQGTDNNLSITPDLSCLFSIGFDNGSYALSTINRNGLSAIDSSIYCTTRVLSGTQYNSFYNITNLSSTYNFYTENDKFNALRIRLNNYATKLYIDAISGTCTLSGNTIIDTNYSQNYSNIIELNLPSDFQNIINTNNNYYIGISTCRTTSLSDDNINDYLKLYNISINNNTLNV